MYLKVTQRKINLRQIDAVKISLLLKYNKYLSYALQYFIRMNYKHKDLD